MLRWSGPTDRGGALQKATPYMSDHLAAAQTQIQGSTLVMLAFDLGFQIDLDAAAPLVADATRSRVLRGRRNAPVWFDYSPAPLRLLVDGQGVPVGDQTTATQTEVMVYDFGAALITYRLPLPQTVEGLPRQGRELYDHTALLADARERAQQVLNTIRPAVERPKLAEAYEDYTVFAITSWGDLKPREVFQANRELFAATIEAEQTVLAEEQLLRSTDGVMAYSVNDLAIIDWNSAIIFDANPEDVVSVLQHANIELLELRILDQELDAILDHADETLSALMRRRFWPGFASSQMMRRAASAQTDAAVMFEGVNNAIKLLGNQYLARLYRLSATRFDLTSWQESVQRKLSVADSLYEKMSDSTATKRLEVLEWVIILLIAISIILPFTPWYH